MNTRKLCDYRGCREYCDFGIRFCDRCALKPSCDLEWAKLKYKTDPVFKAKFIARCRVQYAIRSGKVVRKPCEILGCTDRAEAHHDDYSKPYDVGWLCKYHHTEHHQLSKTK